jgi:4-amino-4-deoxy-L-arabinose transferase-like glycosyltransferase
MVPVPLLEPLTKALRPRDPDDPPWTRSELHAVALLVAGFGLAYTLLARLGLEAFAYSGDEYSYLLQAQIFAGGHLAAPAPPRPDVFAVDHVLLEPALRSKYPPGWPILLALGAACRVPWIVNPLLGALTLALVYALARRLFGLGPAIAATVLVGASPFFAFNAASYHSHTSALLAQVACVTCLAFGWERRAPGWAVLAGAALGLAFCNRQLDAAFYGAGLLVVLPRAPRYVGVSIAAAVAVGALLLAYQAAQFGSPWTTGYALYEPTLLRLYGDTNAHPFTLRHAVDVAGQWAHVQWLAQLADWMAPLAAVVGAVGLVTARVNPSSPAGVCRTIFATAAGAQLVAMVLYGHDSGPGYGPRYLFSLVGPLAFGIAAAWRPVWMWLARGVERREARTSATERWVVRALVLAAAGGLLRCGFMLDRHRDELRHATQLYAMTERLPFAVVVVDDKFPTRWTRNGPRFDGPVLYVTPDLDPSAIRAAIPGREVYVAARAHEAADWTLRKAP